MISAQEIRQEKRAITLVKSTGLDRFPSSCEMEKAHLERLTEERF